MRTLSDDRTKADLVRRLRTLRPDSPRRWGRMSAHQMICHASDACRMAIGEMSASDATGPLQRTVIKWIALYTPLRWPEGVATRPEIDQVLGHGACPTDFAADVATLETLVEALAQRQGKGPWPSHPIFGRMSETDWMRWGFLHLDHHLRQFGA